MTTILVSGVIANKYLKGGAVWTRLNWILGLKKLGFDVYFAEQIDRDTCIDATGAPAAFEESVNLAYFKQITEQFGIAASSVLIYENGEDTHGLTYDELLHLAESTELLVNISGHLSIGSVIRRVRSKAYIDLDPGYTQFWHASGHLGAHLNGYDFYFTIGENIGTPTCPIPTGGIHWQSIRQPIVLEYWNPSKAVALDRFTTVGSWRGPYGPVQYDGRTYGLKVHEFRQFIQLPERTNYLFELALDIDPADAKDVQRLHDHGWRIVDPGIVAPDPDAFRRYVQTSGAEFSVAQGTYVHTNSGWFSDRTVRYLASGRPALVQDTGFSDNLPVGEGLVPFRTMEEAVVGAEQIVRDYTKHSCAARAIVEEYFDSDKVLDPLVDQAGIAP